MRREKKISALSDKIFDIVNVVFAVTFFIIVLYPCIYVVSASFSSPEALISGQVWLFPVKFSLDGYKAVFAEKKVWMGYANSIFYTVAGTAINVFLTAIAAYPLSRKDLVGRKGITAFFTFTMIFNAGMLPTYLAVKSFHLLDSRWALLLPGAINVYNLIITRTFFENTISNELLESAQIDGSSNFQFFCKITLPLSKSVLAVITLFYAVAHWNNFFDSLLYINTPEKYPLQIYLREILTMNSTQDILANVVAEQNSLYMSELLKYALIIVSTVPLLIVYPFIQKNFVKGVMVGAVKG